MKTLLLFILLLSTTSQVFSQDDSRRVVESVFGTNKNEKFSPHMPTYFAFGDDDLKLQVSFKYRLARTFSFYFAYSQLMLWDIYEESKPFEDVNYKPEFFYRFLENGKGFFQSVDMGYLHTSNGQAGLDSRSLDRFFIRTNIVTKIRRHQVGAVVMAYNIYNEDETNKDIVNYMGYWDATFFITDLVRIDRQRLDLELRTYAGNQVINFDRGGHQVGLVYRVGSDNFNPAVYLQRFEGYGESLINYNKRRTEWRLGLMLTF